MTMKRNRSGREKKNCTCFVRGWEMEVSGVRRL